jgi:hypothetical protein
MPSDASVPEMRKDTHAGLLKNFFFEESVINSSVLPILCSCYLENFALKHKVFCSSLPVGGRLSCIASLLVLLSLSTCLPITAFGNKRNCRVFFFPRKFDIATAWQV